MAGGGILLEVSQEGLGAGEFARGGRASVGFGVGEGEAFGVGEFAAGKELRGEGGGGLEDEVAVHHEQCLRGDGGGVAAAGGDGGIGVVELLEEVVEMVADDGEVEGTAGAVVGGGVFGGVVEDELTIFEGNSFAAHRRVEAAGDGEKGVADFFGFETADGEGGEGVLSRKVEGLKG